MISPSDLDDKESVENVRIALGQQFLFVPSIYLTCYQKFCRRFQVTSTDQNVSYSQVVPLPIRNTDGLIPPTTLQVTSCSNALGCGSLPQIPGKTITFIVNHNIKERQHGGHMAKPSRSGNIQVQVRSYGCTENVMSLNFGPVVSLKLIFITL